MTLTEQFTSSEVPPFIIAKGTVYPGHEKAPFVPSGKAFRGCLSYKPEDDLLQCHECGEWFESLAAHLNNFSHGLSVREYKQKHMLRASTSLINRRIQKSLSEKAREGGAGQRITAQQPAHPPGGRPGPKGCRSAGHYEARNVKGTCHAQLIRDIGLVVQRCGGRTPSSGDFANAKRLYGMDRNIHLATVLDSFGVKGVPELMDKLGHGCCIRFPPDNSIPEADLLDSLRDFYVARGRLPMQSEWGQGMLRSEPCYRDHFGSLRAAYEKAGLGLVLTGRKGMVVSDETILEGLRRFWTQNNRLPLGKEFNSHALPFSAALVRNRFGSLEVAMEKSGVSFEIGPMRGSWAAAAVTPQLIMRSLSRFLEEHDGEPPTVGQINAGILGVSCVTVTKYFGSARPEKLMAALARFTDEGLAKAS